MRCIDSFHEDFKCYCFQANGNGSVQRGNGLWPIAYFSFTGEYEYSLVQPLQFLWQIYQLFSGKHCIKTVVYMHVHVKTYKIIKKQSPLCQMSYLLFLTHWGRATHIYVSKLTIIGSYNGLSPSHYLNHCWNIVNKFGNKLQWNLNRNVYMFIQEIVFLNAVWKMATIL